MPRDLNPECSEIVSRLPEWSHDLQRFRENVLANLAMVGEIPAPTFDEADRVAFLMQRFAECGLQNTSSDQVGNGMGIIRGRNEERNLLVVAHADTHFERSVDHTVFIGADSVTGPGVADNSLGMAVLASLPTILDELEIELDANLILLGGVRSLGRGNLEGLRFFLQNRTMPIAAGLCVEGVKLGRLSHSSIGMVRAEIACSVPEEYDWTRFGASSAILTINDVISRIHEIPTPRRPRTNVFLGSIQGGTTFNTMAREAVLRFEIRSESGSIVNEIEEQIRDIAAEIAAQNGVNVRLDVLARRKPGGIAFAHPLAAISRTILDQLDIRPMLGPSTSELAAFIDRSIPAITIGLTTGENFDQVNETIHIDPMFRGLAQLLALILAVDRGCCNED